MEKINFVNDTTPALNATNLNKLQQNVEDVTGDLSELETSAKNNLVEAINEAASTGSGGDTLPIYSIVDYDGDTVPTGYEEVNSYSTSEVKTGDTWIDGKPIYRKVIVETTVNTGSNVLTLDSSIDTMTNYTVYSYRNISATDASNQYIKDSSYTDSNYHIIITYRAYTKAIEVYIKGFDVNKIVAIIEYTKTTDGGNS